MSELHAFLSIERSLGSLGYDAARKKLAPLERHIHREATSGNHTGAIQAIEQVDLKPIATTLERRLPAYARAAFVLGASLAHGGLSKTPSNAVKLLPSSILDAVVAVHTKIVTDRNAILIHRAAAKVVADHEVEQRESAFKGEAYLRKADDLAAALNAAVDGTSKMMSSISANLTTSRLVSYGFLATARGMNITKYQLQAVLDDRTSKICRALDGRVFDVEKAFEKTQQVLETTDPDQLKSIAPFVSGTKSNVDHLEQASDQDLQAEGVMVPPFHPSCRTVLVVVSSEDQIDNVDVEPTEGPGLSGGTVDSYSEPTTQAGGYDFADEIDHELLLDATISKPLGSAEIDAFHAYTENDYYDINSELRSGAVTDSNKNIVSAMDSVFDRASTPEQMTVYRQVDKDTFEKIKGMQQYQDNAFVSTTVDRSKLSGDYILTIDVPAGSKAVPLGHLSEYGIEERELLLARGTRFDVTRAGDRLFLRAIT